MSGFTEVVRDFAGLFFPRFCLGCYGPLVSGEDVLCTHCLLDLPRTSDLQHHQNGVWLRFVGRIPVERAAAFLKFQKRGIVQHLMHEMKYNHHPEVGFRLGKAFGREMELAGMNQFDLIIPVPLHPGRERQRGFNQSVMIARGIGEVIGKPVEEHISVRSKRTATQTTKTRMKRWENVRTVFAVLTPERLKGKSVLLVDDVITTGATLEACAGHLLEAGCSSLSIACLAEAR